MNCADTENVPYDNNPVILYPDFCGHDLAPGKFADEILPYYKNVVALVNGPQPAPVSRNDITIVQSPVLGLAPSLRYGYRAAAALGEVVVRIDTAENPVEEIVALAKIASTHGAAVCDLLFDPTSLREGSADEHSQLDVFPTMFRLFTQDKLSLSGTHGFQAWRSDVLQEVLPVAEELWDRASGPNNAMAWGFDAAMVLAADLVGRTPVVITRPAIALRDRPRLKIAKQHEAVLRVLIEYNNTAKPPTHNKFFEQRFTTVR